MNKSSFRTSFNKIRFLSADLPSVGIYVYVGVSPSFLVFLEVTTIIVVTSFSPIFRFSRSTVTLSEYIQSFLYSFCAHLCARISVTFLGHCLILGRNHRFSYPPFSYFFAVSLRRLANLLNLLAELYAFIGISSTFVKLKHFLFVSFSFVPLL